MAKKVTEKKSEKKTENKNWLESYCSKKNCLTSKITGMLIKGATTEEIVKTAQEYSKANGTKWATTESSLRSHLRFLAERKCTIKKDGAKIQVRYAG